MASWKFFKNILLLYFVSKNFCFKILNPYPASYVRLNYICKKLALLCYPKFCNRKLQYFSLQTRLLQNL